MMTDDDLNDSDLRDEDVEKLCNWLVNTFLKKSQQDIISMTCAFVITASLKSLVNSFIPDQHLWEMSNDKRKPKDGLVATSSLNM